MKENGKDNKKNKLILLIFTIIILMVAIFSLGIFLKKENENKEKNTLAYTNLIKELSFGNIEKIEMETGSNKLKIKMKNEEEEKNAIVPNIESFMELVQSKVAEGNEIELIQKPQSPMAKLPGMIITFLPTVLMVALFVMIMQMQGLGEKGKVYDDTERKTKVKFDDVAGLDEEKAEMVEIVEFLKKPEKYAKMGAREIILDLGKNYVKAEILEEGPWQGVL